MKRFALILVVALASNLVFAQEKIERTLSIDGDLITATYYHANGVIAQEGTYTHDGKLQGKWESFDVQGNLTAVAFYDKGSKVGTWTFFLEDTKKVVSYDNSKITKVTTWELKDTRVVSNKP